MSTVLQFKSLYIKNLQPIHLVAPNKLLLTPILFCPLFIIEHIPVFHFHLQLELGLISPLDYMVFNELDIGGNNHSHFNPTNVNHIFLLRL